MKEVKVSIIKTKLMMILGMAYEISTETKADVFVDYSPHCNSITIRVYKNGWDFENEPDYTLGFKHITLALLNEIIQNLQTLHIDLLVEAIEERAGM